jgi:hypothetical protein
MSGWSREAIGARVDHLARQHEGDAFVVAIREFAEGDLDRRERSVLYDVLIERGKRGMLGRAIEQRRSDGWMRRLLEGRVGRRARLPAPRRPES